MSVDVLVAFLGAPKQYDEVTYVLAGQSCRTPYCPEALVAFLQPKRLVLLVTQTARQAKTGARNNLADLIRRVEQLDCLVVDIPIPDSPFPADAFDAVLWELFAIIAAQIQEEERVAFDVTFGYRFLPLLTVVVGQFLHFAKGAQVVGIYYGAREAADAHDQTPVMNLTGLTEVMDWTNAAAHFARTGNAGPFVQQQGGQPDESLQQVLARLEDVSHSLRLGLAVQIGRAVTELLAALQQIPPQGLPYTAPLHALFDQIAEKYAPLAIADPLTPANATAHLRQQAALIDWYVRNGQELHAVLLVREWLITRVMVASRVPDLLFWDKREQTSQLLNTAVHHNSRHTLTHVPQHPQVITLWRVCTQARNQLAHMSMDSRARSLADLRAAVAQLAAGIAALEQTL